MNEHDTPTPETEVEPSPEEMAALEAAFEKEFGGALARAHQDAADAMEPVRLDVLARVRNQLDDESISARRRDRRRHLRILFYVLNLIAIVLICVIYVMTRATIRLKEIEGRTLATRTEVVAISRALVRRRVEDKQAPLPQDFAELLATLAASEGRGAAYPFDPHRLKGAIYLDDFGRPYRIRVERNRVLIYSVGANGRDDQGLGDDIADEWVTFIR